KIEPGRLENRGVVCHVGKTTPDIKGSARLKYAGQVAEPSRQQPIEIGVGHEVIRQGAVPGAEFLGPWLGFLRMANGVGAGVGVVIAAERAEAGRDSVIAAWLDADVVRRICVH